MAIVPFTDPQAFGVVGGHANMEEWSAVTRIATNTDEAPFGFGQPVQRVTAVDQACEAWDGLSAPIGITRFTYLDDIEAGFAEHAHVPVMTMGVMYVAAGAAATAGAQAGYDPATDRWADVAGDFVAVPGVEFDTTATAGNIVKIRIQRPAPAV